MFDQDNLKWQPSDRYKEIMAKDKVSAVEVNEVLIECFIHAHGDEGMARAVLKKQYSDLGADMEAPTKQNIFELMGKLKGVASSFRNPEVISSNYMKIKNLLDRCDC